MNTKHCSACSHFGATAPIGLRRLGSAVSGRLFARSIWHVLIGLLTLVTSIPIWAAGVQVSASLQPEQIGLDEAAQLTVTAQGSQVSQPALPSVDGLQFAPMGQSSSFQFVNGSASSSVSYTYQVTAMRTGSYRIPPIRVGNASSQPLVLRVIQQAGGGQGGTSSLPPPNVNWPQNNTPQNSNGELAFLRVVAPKHQLYVGEVMPVQIKAYFRSGMSASLNGLPTLSSDAFTMSKLTGQPAQTQELVEGTPYTVVTWPAALSAVKEGDYSLNMELPVVVRLKQRSTRNQRQDPFGSFFGDSPFDDPIFDGFFGRVTQKQLTLQSDKSELSVKSLPNKGVPADFSGAVGQFEVAADVAPKSATVGDPLTLTLKISGKGSFDRVSADGLANAPGWKTYRPGGQFEPEDSLGLAGTKTFTQAVIPEQAGEVSLPAVSFSYFDPEAQKYVTRRTEPIPLHITPGSPTLAAAAPRSNDEEESTSPKADQAQDELAPNAVEPGPTVATLRPVFYTTGFVAVPAASLALLAGGLWFVRRRERLTADPVRQRLVAANAAIRESLDRMEAALSAGETIEFFSAARRALQQRLALAWKISPGSVTLTEIGRRLNGAGEELISVFREADQIAYSGQNFSTGELERWREVVYDQLKQVEEL